MLSQWYGLTKVADIFRLSHFMLQYIIGQQNPLSYECHVKERIVEFKCELFFMDMLY